MFDGIKNRKQKEFMLKMMIKHKQAVKELKESKDKAQKQKEKLRTKREEKTRTIRISENVFIVYRKY